MSQEETAATGGVRAGPTAWLRWRGSVCVWGGGVGQEMNPHPAAMFSEDAHLPRLMKADHQRGRDGALLGWCAAPRRGRLFVLCAANGNEQPGLRWAPVASIAPSHTDGGWKLVLLGGREGGAQMHEPSVDTYGCRHGRTCTY